MKTKCKICKEVKDNVSPKFIQNELIDPKPPFTQRQLVAKTLTICQSCYEKFKRGEIDIK